jgi:putative ABC transport system permease protein
MNEIWRDFRFAFRLLGRDRGFTATAVFVLGIGIGINNMFFTILYAHTLRGLPIAGADRIVHISAADDRTPDRALSFAEFTALSGSQTLLNVAAFTTTPVTVAGHARAAERLEAVYVSPNAFELIRATALRGRGFTPEDDRPGAAPVAMISAAAWRGRFGADPSILGDSMLVNGAPVTVVGIAPDESGLPAAGQIWLPLRQAPGLGVQPSDTRTLRLLGRMRDGVALSEVSAEVDGLIARVSRETSSTPVRNLRARVMPINERFFGRLGDPAWRAFIAASVLVALISCANAANLMLARSARRARELAIRASVGANRIRLLRQLLIEGFVLAAAGAIVGLGISIGGVQLFRTAIPERALPYWIQYGIDGRVLAALVVVSMASVILFALLPAVRGSKADLNRVLKEGGRAASDRSTRRWSTAFLVAEFALAVVLLAQLVVSFRSSAPAVASDRVLDTRAAVVTTVTIPAVKYPAGPQRVELVRRLQERVAAIGGVSAVTVASVAPLAGAPEARLQSLKGEALGTVRTVTAGPRYFDTLAVPLVRGRDFADADAEPGPSPAIVNDRFARQFFAGRDPIGEQIALAASSGTAVETLTIVGVAADIRQRPVPEPDPIVYLPYRGAGSGSILLLIRSDVEVSALVPRLRQEVLALDPILPVDRIHTMQEGLRTAQWNLRVSHRLILLLTFIAIALSTVGLYAVTAHGVAQRTQEIGVRMALGARPSQVLLVVGRRVLFQVALGYGAGIVCTLGWQRIFSSGRVDLSVVDPRALAAIGATLIAAALIACYVPAHRAIRLDPVKAIRGD